MKKVFKINEQDENQKEVQVQNSKEEKPKEENKGGLVDINKGPEEVLNAITSFTAPAPGGKKSENPVKPEIAKILKSGKTDSAGPEDEITKITYSSAKCSDMFPTQKQIGTGASLDDQILSKWGNLDAAIAGLNGATKMNSDGGQYPVLCFKAGDGKIWILDGHHRWSQAYATSPNCNMSIALLEAPQIKEPKQALAVCHTIIATIFGKSPTKSFKGINLLEQNGEKVREYIKSVWSKSDETYTYANGKDRKISEGKAECLSKLKQAGLIKEGKEEEAINLYAKNCDQLIKNSNSALAEIGGGFSRDFMPQPGEAGDPNQLTKTLPDQSTGTVNFLEPSKADVKESRIIKKYEMFLKSKGN